MFLAHFYYQTHQVMGIIEANSEICRVNLATNPLPDPIFDLQCHDTCSDGTFATVDFLTGEMICENCPANTYSVGSGGLRIDGSMGAFGFVGEDGNAVPLRMEASC